MGECVLKRRGGNIWQEVNHLHYVVNAEIRNGNNTVNIILYCSLGLFISIKIDGAE
jgi:hypothetical protein